MKRTQDYLHYYIGCECVVLDIDGGRFNDKIECVKHSISGKYFGIYEFGDMPFDNHDEYYQDIKLILRNLKNITDQEMIELSRICNAFPYGWFNDKDNWDVRKTKYPDEGVELVVLNNFAIRITNNKAFYFYDYSRPGLALFMSETFEIVNWLILKRFDLFNLIEDGLAFDMQLWEINNPNFRADMKNDI